VEATAVDDEVVEEVVGGHAVVERDGVTEVLVPNLVDNGADEEGGGSLGREVGGEVGEFGLVDGLLAVADD